jgi:arsenate reductase
MAPEVRVLVAPDCPHGESTIQLVRSVVGSLIPATPVGVEWMRSGAAIAKDFRGSPTVLVGGLDLEHPDPPPPANGCRLYRSGVGGEASGTPPRWLVEAAILRALGPRHVLFLCVANSARSQMAEGLARALAGDGTTISSAGSQPSSVRPQAIAALQELGLDISGHRSKGIEEADDGTVDTVITLCEEEVCPAYLGRALRVHWGLPDPAGAGATPAEEMAAFSSVRDELGRRLARLFGFAAFDQAVVRDGKGA